MYWPSPPFRRWLLVLSLAAVMAEAVVAQQKQSDQTVPATPGDHISYRISGKVVDARTGQVLRQCVVQINPTTQRFTAASVTTGEDGAFAFTGLAAGKYALTATHRGYLPQAFEEHSGFSTAIAVGPDNQADGLRFQLMPQAIITGTVTDEAGEPVRSAQVRLFEDQDRDGARSTRPHAAVATDDRGVYEIARISPGNYYIAVTAQPWYAQRAPHLEGALPAGSSDALDVAYPTVYYPNATDSDDATPIPVKGGERIEINLTMSPQHALRLRVAVPEGNRNGYSISLQQSIFGQTEPVSIQGMENRGDVMFIDGILPGHYEVTMSTPERMTHFTADLASGATALSEQNEEPEVTVTGKVLVDKKIANASIGLQNRKEFRNYSGPLNDAGEFSINAPPGEYEVVGFIPQHYLATIASSNAEVKGRTLQVRAGSSPRLEIVAGAGFAHIDGVARLAGKGTGGVLIVLAPEDAKNNRIRFRRDQSDSDGTFSLFDVIPGRYRLYAIADGWDLEWADPNVLAAYQKKSVPLVIQASVLLRQEVEVQPR